jgi:drug/metabolite transporter (DMT)-like permease
MKNLFLYLVTVAIWGSTWYAITFQLNGTPTQVSVAYRFALATLILFVWCWLRRMRLRFSPGTFGIDVLGSNAVLGELRFVL